MKANSARVSRPMRFSGVPWLILKETPPPPSFMKSRNRPTHSRQNTPIETLETSKTIPSAGRVFSHDEASVIDDCSKAPEPKAFFKSPSRLAQIQMSHFESAQTPLSMDLKHSSLIYFPATTIGRPKQDLESTPMSLTDKTNESLISCGDIDTEEEAIVQVDHSILPNDSTLRSSFVDNLSPAITNEDLKESVLSYCHKLAESETETNALPFNADINSNVAIPIHSTGRQRLLKAIHTSEGPKKSCCDPENFSAHATEEMTARFLRETFDPSKHSKQRLIQTARTNRSQDLD